MRLLHVRDSGEKLILGDQSVWEVSPGDIPTACTWMPTARVRLIKESGSKVYLYKLTNEEIDETISVRPVAQSE